MIQKITSAKTCRHQVPAIFKKVKETYGWERGSVNVDIGAGSYFDLFSNALDGEGVTNYPYDPYNCSKDWNEHILSTIRSIFVDTVTISNVLNVVQAPVRHDILKKAKLWVKSGGTIYITIYEGNRSGVGKESRYGWQSHMRLRDYEDDLASVFTDWKRKNGMIVI